jgi:phosphatidylglycerophosphate synthase
MAKPSLAELRAATYKPRDSWWTVLLTDPVAIRLVRVSVPHRWITPNRVTLLAFLTGLGAAACFLQGTRGWLIAGALIFQLSFVLDCVDGKIARWNRTGSILGSWLDFGLDQVRLAVCVLALFGGVFRVTHNATYLVVAVVVVFLAMFRYFNGFLIDRARAQMAGADAAPAIGDEDGETSSAPTGGVFGWLASRRIRGNVFSGIEFGMAVLVIAPLTGFVLTVSIAACVAMVGFEAAHSYRFFRAWQRYAQPVRANVPDQRSAQADRAVH